MRRIVDVVIALLLFSVFSAGAPRTLRVDYYHTGNAHEEWFSLDRVVLEPLDWPGNPHKAIDESQLGDYLFEVREQSSGKLLYSRGFNSVFGEWKTTEEARHGNRTFSESLRFPTPDVIVEVSLKERDASGFHEVWKTVVDPRDKFVDRARRASPGPLMELQKMGTRRGRWICWCWVMGTRLRSERSLRKTRVDSSRCCSEPRHFASTVRTSTFGGCAQRRNNRACRGPRAEFTAGRQWALRTTLLGLSAMC